MKFLAYSDIHHDDYNNGITLNDTIAIEDEITTYALNNHIQYVFNVGDWYRATNPIQSVIKEAEASLKRRCDAGIQTFIMPGNHDRWTKSPISGHAFIAANIFKSDLNGVHIFDNINMHNIEGINFLFIPAGHENIPINNLNYPLVVLFHGLLEGSHLPFSKSTTGINPNILKQLNANLILGGDNHTPQDLSHLLGCASKYLGAPLQHNWGDTNQKRGFWYIDIDENRILCHMIETNSPLFVKLQFDVINETDAISKIYEELNKFNNRPLILEIKLMGKNIMDLDLKIIERIFNHFNIKRYKFILDKNIEKLKIITNISNTELPEDKWSLYIAHGKFDLNNLDVTVLNEIGKWAIQEAKRNT